MIFKNGVFISSLLRLCRTDLSCTNSWYTQIVSMDRLFQWENCSQQYNSHAAEKRESMHDWIEKQSNHQLRRDEIHIIGMGSHSLLPISSSIVPFCCAGVHGWYWFTVRCLHRSVLHCCYRCCCCCCWRIEYVIKINGKHICFDKSQSRLNDTTQLVGHIVHPFQSNHIWNGYCFNTIRKKNRNKMKNSRIEHWKMWHGLNVNHCAMVTEVWSGAAVNTKRGKCLVYLSNAK